MSIGVSWSELDKFRAVSIGGSLYFAELLLLYPTDVVRTRLQVATSPESARLLSGVGYVVREVMRDHGTRGFYRGFWLSTLGAFPGYACHVGVYVSLKERLQKMRDSFAGEAPRNYSSDGHTWWVPLVAGAVADGSSKLFATPVDVVAQRLQLYDPRYRTGMEGFRRIVLEEGIRGLYTGLVPAIARDAPLSALWWATYEGCKRVLSHYDKPNENSILPGWRAQLGAGFAAQAVNQIAGNPMDVVITRIQTQRTAPGVEGFFGVLREMVRTEGMLSLSRGLGPKILVNSPVAAFSSLSYELVLHLSRKSPTSNFHLTQERQPQY